MPRCEGRKVDGKRCTKTVANGVTHCSVHKIHRVDSFDVFEEALDKMMDEVNQIAQDMNVIVPYDTFVDVPDPPADVIPETPVDVPETPVIVPEISVDVVKTETPVDVPETPVIFPETPVDVVKTETPVDVVNTIIVDHQNVGTNTDQCDLQKEIDILRALNEALNTEITKMKEDNTPKKRKRQIKNKHWWAKLVWYHVVKKDASVISDLKTELNCDKVHWRCIKKYADEQYEAMTENEKEQWIRAAYIKYDRPNQ
jgi:hypothetical protein